MKFLVCSLGGDGVATATRLKEEGEEVSLYVREPHARLRGSGFITPSHSLAASLDLGPEVVVMDSAGMGKEADAMRSMGHKVIGGSRLQDKFANDRAFVVDLCKRVGIETSPAVGREVFTEVWFAEGRPISYPVGVIELKRFMAGDVGPDVGCMASVVWAYSRREPRIVQQTIKKLYPALLAAKYTGPMGVNAVVSDAGRAHLVSLHPGLRFSALHALAELLGKPLGEAFYDLVSGSGELHLEPGFAAAIRLAMLPFPLVPTTAQSEFLSKRPVEKLPAGHFWPLDIWSSGGKTSCGGHSGILGDVTYADQNLASCVRKVYEMISRVRAPDVLYRNDVEDYATRVLQDLDLRAYETPVGRNAYGTDTGGLEKIRTNGNGATRQTVRLGAEA